MRQPVAERFWRHVQKTDTCWLWTAAIGRLWGYGLFQLSAGKQVRAHRMSWMLTYGEIDRTQFVLHKCDNRACVRADHLFIGTQADNIKDMIAKGRQRWAVGEKNGSTKLNAASVIEIRRRVAAGETQRSIARDFDVHQSVVSMIMNGKAWRSVA